MSQFTSTGRFTPPAHPAHFPQSQVNAYVSSLGTNSTSNSNHNHNPNINININPRVNPTSPSPPSPPSNPVLSNRLIPRDYPSSQSKAGLSPDTQQSRVLPLAPEANISRLTNPPDIGTGVRSTRSDKYWKYSGASDKENIDARNDIQLDGAASPDFLARSASAGGIGLSSQLPTTGALGPKIPYTMPRTSSIDSAISSVSASSLHRKDHGDPRDPSPASIRGLIATAGSAENLVLHLLKEKNNAASQNNQLWKLVEKQRALLLGLNKDLERITKDRDKHKKKLKELQSQGALPRAATQSPSRDLVEHDREDAVKPPEIPLHELTSRSSPYDSIPQDRSSPLDAPDPTLRTIAESPSSPPIQHPPTITSPQSAFATTEVNPLSEKPVLGFSASRKAVPKPLNLARTNGDPAPPGIVNAADRALLASDTDEDQPRGRRKTREEDDKDREKSLLKDQETRSKSNKPSAPPAQVDVPRIEQPPTIAVPLPASPRPTGLMPNNALHMQYPGGLHERLIPMPLRSPGLPASPRPMQISQAPFATLPTSPRAPPPGPLSPRAPKQPIPPPMMSPSPFTDPAVIQRQNAMARQAVQQSYQQQDRLQVHDPATTIDIPQVYQGLVSSQYPNLLLPPNALPSIQIQVASSRLRPSRHSMLGLRAQEDSTVFSLSIFSRASRNELWRVEKIPAVLPQLEQQLKPRCKDLPRLPERKLFSGHSPAVVDARRQAVDAYFEELLDIEMDEPSALIICRFLSTDVLDPSSEPAKHPGVNQESLPQNTSSSGKVVKTGFLTKRGKNFGGWKSRYFVLDSPELKYYETPGGPHLGTIKLVHARIGSQKADEAGNTDPEDQYRHAFLIQEPKKKDSGTYVRHVLCAESDPDRDQWVSALLHYVEAGDLVQAESPSLSYRPQTSGGKDRVIETHSNSPSPTTPGSVTDIGIHDALMRSTNISGPMNGAPIHDSTQWGNRMTAQQPREKASKMGSIFHFKKGSQEQLSQANKQSEPHHRPRILRHNGYVRAVFGLSLTEAVEFCAPFNIDVQLPAVVYRSIEYLRFCKAANEEGLFRLSGSNLVVKTLKERFNEEGDVDLVDEEDYYDVHAVASLFKTYLRELPSPLLTRNLHIEFLKVLELETQAEKVTAFNTLVHRLPSVNFQLLRAMSEYLLEVTENSAKNKMSVRNMGIVFSPTINIPTPVFNLFLSEFKAIFDDDLSTRQPVQAVIQQTDLRVPDNLSPEDIRSPRHQMFSDLPTPAYDQTNFSATAPVNPSHRPGHQKSTSEEFGLTPLQPSYESGQYVSNPQEFRTQAFIPSPLQNSVQQIEGEEQYGSLNRILVPQGATTDKRRKRESAMLF